MHPTNIVFHLNQIVMKKILWLTACCFLIAAAQLQASTPSKTDLTTPEQTTAAFAALQNLTTDDLLSLTPERYRLHTGKKLSLGERISLRLVKKSIRKHLKRGETFVLNDVVESEKFKFKIGAFLLGFFFGLIGFLVSLAFKDRRNAMISAGIGWAIGVVIVLTLIL